MIPTWYITLCCTLVLEREETKGSDDKKTKTHFPVIACTFHRIFHTSLLYNTALCDGGRSQSAQSFHTIDRYVILTINIHYVHNMMSFLFFCVSGCLKVLVHGTPLCSGNNCARRWREERTVWNKVSLFVWFLHIYLSTTQYFPFYSGQSSSQGSFVTQKIQHSIATILWLPDRFVKRGTRLQAPLKQSMPWRWHSTFPRLAHWRTQGSSLSQWRCSHHQHSRRRRQNSNPGIQNHRLWDNRRPPNPEQRDNKHGENGPECLQQSCNVKDGTVDSYQCGTGGILLAGRYHVSTIAAIQNPSVGSWRKQ